jgi:hypothetical protein
MTANALSSFAAQARRHLAYLVAARVADCRSLGFALALFSRLAPTPRPIGNGLAPVAFPESARLSAKPLPL